MKFSLAKKLTLFNSFFLLLVIVPIFGYFYLEYREMTERQARNYLVSLAEAIEGQVFLFFDKNKIQISDWTSDGHIREEFENIITRDGDRKEQVSLGEYIKKNKHSVASNVAITDIFDLSGTVVVSTLPERIGRSEQEKELEEEYSFRKARAANYGEAFVASPVMKEDEAGHSQGEVMWHVSTPVVSLHTGRVIGVMVNHILGNELADVLAGTWQEKQGAQSGQEFLIRFKTSEVYLVNEDKIMITPSRFIKEAVLRQRVNTPPVDACLEDGVEFDGSYEDYRGVKVYGASMCMAGQKTVLIVEIDEEELFAELKKEKRDFIILVGLFLVVGVLGSILFSRFFFKNLTIIYRTAMDAKEGNFSVRAAVKASDETGALAAAFNAVLDTVEGVKRNIEEAQKVVREKVVLLEGSIKEHERQEGLLEESKKATLNILEDMFQTKAKLEEEDYRLQTILSSIGDGLVLIDGQYKIALVNPKAEEFLGFTNKELLGNDLRSVIKLFKKKKEEVPSAMWPIEEMFLKRSQVSIGLEAELSLATERHVAQLPITLSVAPLGGGLAGAVIVIRDVTEDRALDDAKSGFISVASHQLRTPLTTIRWYSEMLLSEDVGVLSPAQQDFLKEVHSGAERLYQTIDLLLGISRVESGRIKTEKSAIDLATFTVDIVKELRPSIDEKKLTFTVTPLPAPVVVSLDPLMLRQVVLNLASNAIRYTNEGGTVEMRWKISDDSKHVVYEVRDNGIGIPRAQQNRIFTKFFRAENALVKVPDGSGLGLALVKELTESWGGRVWFETEEGKGTVFYFTIPLQN